MGSKTGFEIQTGEETDRNKLVNGRVCRDVLSKIFMCTSEGRYFLHEIRNKSQIVRSVRFLQLCPDDVDVL
jgi:hypothetical protein